ncbi:protein pxr1-like [Limosa lapponica baueri]|uniref:Protein pxr1-like n=1 Tax=Limosa lapponica baueri TaxID=1758121 RepID=A0A2I0UCS4_LIMLA|nr:protein pxr1-like [Limosa lapponica baueri]
MPAGSNDLSLAKAKPISNGGSISVRTYLRRGKNCCATAADRGVRICKRNNSADTKVREEEGEGGAAAEILPQPVVKTMVRQAVSLQPMGVQSGEDTTCSLCRTPHQSR